MGKDILAEDAKKQKIYKELGGKYICPVCGEIFQEKKTNSTLYFVCGILCLIASFFISFILLILLIFLAASFMKSKKCAKCGSKDLIPIKSQIGKQIVIKYYPEKQNLLENI